MFIRTRILLLTALCVAASFVSACDDDNSNNDPADAADGVADCEDVPDDSDASTTCTGDELLLVSADSHSPPGQSLVLTVSSNVSYELSARTIGSARPLELTQRPGNGSAVDVWLLQGPATPERVLVTAVSGSQCAAESTARIVFVPTPTTQSNSSSTIAQPSRSIDDSDGLATKIEQFAVIEEDAGALSVFSVSEGVLSLNARAQTCEKPARVAWSGNRLAVTCPASNEVVLHDAASGQVVARIHTEYASAPFAIVPDTRVPAGFIAASRFREELYVIRDDALMETVEHHLTDVRGMMMADDDTLFLSRWRSERAGGSILRMSLSTGTTSLITLPFDERQASDTETGGVPSYLDVMTLTPDGQRMFVPGLQANVAQGEFLDGRPLIQDEVLRAQLSVLERSGSGDFQQTNRILFDDRGLASSVVTSPFGDYAFIAMRGSRLVERQDLLRNDVSAGTLLNVGLNPVSMVMTEDGHLIVHSTMSRELSSWNTADWGPSLRATDRASTVYEEPLNAEFLRGKAIFNDAFDRRITQDSYLACAHCHLDGESDQRIWDFTDRDEGLRRTISLRGRAGTGHGPLHWTANFDEVQDFENDMRNHFGGLGFLSPEQWADDNLRDALGAEKAGLSADLDALATYVSTFDSFPQSPNRTRDGALSEQAEVGADLFLSDELSCVSCHRGDKLTDSAMLEDGPRLHDVGTILTESGTRQGQPLTGLDTPTLHALFNSQTYLHHGQAADLYEVFASFGEADAHGDISSLDDTELDALVEFILSLDGTFF